MATSVRSTRTPKAVKGPGSDGDFTYTTLAGATLTLPSMATLNPSMGAVEDVALASSDPNPLVALGAQIKFLASFLPDETYQQMRAMGAVEFQDFVVAWGEHSGTSVGELSAS